MVFQFKLFPFSFLAPSIQDKRPNKKPAQCGTYFNTYDKWQKTGGCHAGEERPKPKPRQPAVMQNERSLLDGLALRPITIQRDRLLRITGDDRTHSTPVVLERGDRVQVVLVAVRRVSLEDLDVLTFVAPQDYIVVGAVGGYDRRKRGHEDRQWGDLTDSLHGNSNVVLLDGTWD